MVEQRPGIQVSAGKETLQTNPKPKERRKKERTVSNKKEKKGEESWEN